MYVRMSETCQRNEKNLVSFNPQNLGENSYSHWHEMTVQKELIFLEHALGQTYEFCKYTIPLGPL